jgi:hypothetical protein
MNSIFDLFIFLWNWIVTSISDSYNFEYIVIFCLIILINLLFGVIRHFEIISYKLNFINQAIDKLKDKKEDEEFDSW